MSRLRLDFNIEDDEGRVRFVKNYLKSPNVKDDKELEKYKELYSDRPFPFPHKPTRTEMNMIGNYILWGRIKDSNGELGDNITKSGYIEIEDKGKWNKKKTESLDNILDVASETGAPIEARYNVTSDLSGSSDIKPMTRIPKANLSRDEVRKELSQGRRKNDDLLAIFEDLWKEIDYLDYAIETYKIDHGMRKKDIREELVSRLDDEVKAKAEAFAAEMSGHRYGKVRRLLIDLRQEQYALRDMYAPTQYFQSSDKAYTGDKEGYVAYLPFGLCWQDEVSKLVYKESVPTSAFSDENRKKISDRLAYYEDASYVTGAAGVFSFVNAEHIALLVYSVNDLRNETEAADLEKRELLESLIRTYEFYTAAASLKPVPRRILELKELGQSNGEITESVNKEFNKTYAPNYISTIFTKQVCGVIAETAELHAETIHGIIGGLQNFKKCRECGKRLLLSDKNFNQQRNQLDGYMTKCKSCKKKTKSEV